MRQEAARDDLLASNDILHPAQHPPPPPAPEIPPLGKNTSTVGNKIHHTHRLRDSGIPARWFALEQTGSVVSV